MSAEKEAKQTAEEYTIKFIPPQGGDVKTIRLPKLLLKYGVASLLVGALLFVGAFRTSFPKDKKIHYMALPIASCKACSSSFVMGYVDFPSSMGLA